MTPRLSKLLTLAIYGLTEGERETARLMAIQHMERTGETIERELPTETFVPREPMTAREMRAAGAMMAGIRKTKGT